jgi:hypothetical protein
VAGCAEGLIQGRPGGFVSHDLSSGQAQEQGHGQ